MKAYVLRRLLWMVPTMLGITFLAFAAIHVAPGDPASVIGGVAAEGTLAQGVDVGAARAAIARRYGFDRPLVVQYLNFLGPFNLLADGHPWFGGSGADPWGGLLALDLGSEIARPSVGVAGELGRRLLVTLPIALASVLLAYLVAIPLGVLSAVRRGSALDRASTFVVFVLYAIPTFWGALMLALVFGASGLGWLPAIGLHDKDAADLGPFAYAVDAAAHAVLPVVALALGNLAYLSRQTRAGVIEALAHDSIRTARAMGIPERAVILRHALRNGLLPVITLLGSVLPVLVGGSVVVETVFDLPGMGRYAYEGLLARDYHVILATTTLAAAMTLFGTLAADIAYGIADPRIRRG